MNLTRLLLLEDEPVSRAFLEAALAPVARRIDIAVTCSQALATAAADDDAWVFDANLPDGSASGLLARLRERGWRVPALALTADPDAVAGLRGAGFARVMCKPLAGVELRNVVAGMVAAGHAGSLWDDARALPALAGREDSLAALRDLFLRELPAQIAHVRDCLGRGDVAAARAELHRLKAGCGFVGASALAAAVAALHAAPDHASALEDFLHHGRRHLADA
jgi:DNA-binding response OmpR family regulator